VSQEPHTCKSTRKVIALMTRRTRRIVVAFAVTVLLAPLAALQAAEKLARPTPEQVAWHDMELEMFIHLAPSTWQDTQHDNLSTPLSAINPEQLDTEQWADVAITMGAKQIVFVAKHVGGFCWWPTDTTDYSVKNTSWRGGKGDVLKDLADSCRKRGLKLGVYLSPADGKHKIGVGGRAKVSSEQENYNRIYRQQLAELLSRYGDISEVWFDGSNIVPVADILRKHAPRAIIFQGPQATIRWIGNEEGIARYPTWNALSSAKAISGVATAFDSDPDGAAWLPNECDARIRADWFWSTKNALTLKTVAQLMSMYYRSVGHGAVLLLNQTPDTTGRIPTADANRTAEFGAEIQRRFGRSLAETTGRGHQVALDLGKPTRLDHVVIAEDIRQGERVREYIVEGFADGIWRELCEGTAIGHKKIDRFAPVEVSQLRLRVTSAAAEPMIRRLAAFSVWGQRMPAESAAEMSSVTHTIWRWSADTVEPQWTTVKIPLTPFCKDAGVYVLEFPCTAGKELEVQSVNLISRGQKLDKFVVRRTVRGATQYHITITEEGSEAAVEVVARLPDPAARGQATLYQRLW
jgi:alpha-L-fucosidase